LPCSLMALISFLLSQIFWDGFPFEFRNIKLAAEWTNIFYEPTWSFFGRRNEFLQINRQKELDNNISIWDFSA
jgi:hypothetical protein